MRTTFEITHGALGAQNSVLGGGRYDGLGGIARLESSGAGHRIFHRRRSPGDERRGRASGRAQARGRRVSRALGRSGGAARRRPRGGVARRRASSVERSVDRKLKRALEVANKMGARFALILGDNEIARRNILIEGHDVQASRQSLSQAKRSFARNFRKTKSWNRTSRFFRRPSPHAYLRGTARLRCRQASHPDGLGAPPPRSGRRGLHPPARPRRRDATGLHAPTATPTFTRKSSCFPPNT